MAKAKATAKVKAKGFLKQALLGSFLFSILAMSPVLSHFSTHKFGPNLVGFGSDSYSFLYSMWIHGQPADGVIRSETHDLLSGYPTPRPFGKHIQIGSGLAYFMSGLGVPPAAAYNIMIWLWFFLTYFFSFYVGKALGFSSAVAHLIALIIGLNPYQSLQAVDHIDLAMTWPVLLDIYLLIRQVVYKDIRAFPALIVLTGFSVFAHPYYLIFLLFINGAPLLWFTIQMILRKEKATPKFIAVTAASAAICGGIVLFWRSLFGTEGGGLAKAERSIEHLYVYSTKIWDFILPPHFSRPFARFTTEFKTSQTMDSMSNFVENTLYPGALVLIGLSVAIVWAFVRNKQFLKWVRSNPGLTLLLTNLVLVPILFSVSPTFNIFDFEISTPTQLVHKFLPQFRTMSRLAYVASVGLVLIFGFLLQRYVTKSWALVLIGLLFIVDLGYFHQNFYSDTTRVPAVYSYLRDSTPPKSVIYEVPYMWGYISTYWQSYHHRPNFGIFDAADPNYYNMAQTNRMELGGLLSYCRANKIDYLILHSADPLQLPFKAFESTPDDSWIFFNFARYSYVIPVADVRN